MPKGEQLPEANEGEGGENKEQQEASRQLREMAKSIENESRETPTKEQIMDFLGVDAEKCSIVKEKKDESGLYYLEFKVEGKEEESIEYSYMREGEFDTHKSGRTSLVETIYDAAGDFVKYPEHIATFEGGEWKRV